MVPHRALAALVLVACSKTSPTSSETAQPSATATDTSTIVLPTGSAPDTQNTGATPSATAGDTQAAVDPNAPVVKLLDAGAAPREKLRYDFGTTRERMRMDMKLVMSLNLGGGATPVTMPTVRTDLEVTPVTVAPDGTLTATSIVTRADILNDAALPAAATTKLASDLKTLVGTRGRFVVTSRGFTKEATIELSPTAPDNVQQLMESMKDSLRQLSTVLPDEPVGLGAKWEVQTSITTKAMHFDQRALYTLKGRTPTSADEEVSLTQTAPPQTMNLPQKLPPGTSVNLRSHRSTGNGHVRETFGLLTPTSHMHSQTNSTMVTSTNGTAGQSIDMGLTMDMSVRPLP